MSPIPSTALHTVGTHWTNEWMSEWVNKHSLSPLTLTGQADLWGTKTTLLRSISHITFVTGFVHLTAMGMAILQPVTGPCLTPDLLREDTRHSEDHHKTTYNHTAPRDSLLQPYFSRVQNELIYFSNTRHWDVDELDYLPYWFGPSIGYLSEEVGFSWRCEKKPVPATQWLVQFPQPW